MGAVKKTISIAPQLVAAASQIQPNFSAVVETALVEYFQHHRCKKALQAFGSWERREASSVDLVNALRMERGGRYEHRTH